MKIPYIKLGVMSFILSIILLLTVGCEKKSTTEEMQITEDLQEVIAMASDCEEELIATERCFAQEAPNGEEGFTQYYFSNGDQLQSVGHYSQGIQEGFWKVYYPNGELEWEGHFSQGKREGFWKDYYENGQVQEEGHYVACKREGFWKFYHASGQVEQEGFYQEAVRVGKWQFYDEKGQFIHEVYFDCF